MQPLITRKVALDRGLPRYFTGKPCKNGHVAERHTSGAYCVLCNRDRAKIKSPHDSMRKREQNLKTRYGMEMADFVRRVTDQAGRCAICRNLTKKLVVDHCHDKERVRELLCSRCNNILGLAEDQIEILQGAMDYLIKHS